MQAVPFHQRVVDEVFRFTVFWRNAGVFVLCKGVGPVKALSRAGKQQSAALLIHLNQYDGIVHKIHDAVQLICALGNFQIADLLAVIGYLLHNTVHHSVLTAGEEIPVRRKNAEGV